ncbi:MAG: cytochrome oxidase small assembly protein [Rhodocyclaceae bacterium]|nr:hypothetical protein [Rhodocyclaceae bacterium]MBP7080317.1 cytochrome oxidase small assembly protein [Rhodocyclaceae bacterium]
MNNSVETGHDEDQTRQANNRRVGLILAMLAGAVFISVIFRQWVTGGV